MSFDMALPSPPGRIPITLWHDPSSNEGRRAIALLAPLPVDLTLVNHLREPPGASEIWGALAKLGIAARALVRSDEPLFEKLELSGAGDEALVGAMAAHPILIASPLAFVGDRAVIARPAELIYRLIAPPAPADGGREVIRQLLQRKR